MSVHSRSFFLAIIGTSTILLSACGGGGGGGGSTTHQFGQGGDVGAIQTLTNAAPPAETVADQIARGPGILSRADSLVVSSAHGETQSSEIPTFIARSSCSGTVCRFTERRTGLSLTLRLSDLEFAPGNSQSVSTKHDITLIRSVGSFQDINFRALGTWMQHSGFTVQMERSTIQDILVDARYGMAGGDLTGSQPLSNATWQGLMVGTPATGAGRGDRLQGDATLTYSFNNQSLDAAFTNIWNIDSLTAHSVAAVRFTDVPVDRRGRFEAGLTGNKIQGGFYGPSHIEAAGIFEQSNMVGAFGTKKQ